MYCSACGSQIQNELNYCNRCGAKVSGGDPALQKSVAGLLTSVMGAIGSIGLVAFIFVVYLVVRSGGDVKVLIPISFFYLATIFGICFLLLRQVADLTGRSRPNAINQTDTAAPSYLKPATTAQLEESHQPGISVTENTTRTLDEVLIERK
jgi:uncharacterized membrane protein YvbJ